MSWILLATAIVVAVLAVLLGGGLLYLDDDGN